MAICLEHSADLHTAQLMPLPLNVSCFSKIQTGFTFLVPAHPSSPGHGAVKRVCVCMCVYQQLTNAYAQFLKQTHTHNRLMALCLGLPGVSQYQKKHSPTHTHEEEEGFAQTTRSAF